MIDWLENHLLPCAYKQIFGFECPGCGFQRAFIELLKGNIWESIKIYPALIPTIFLTALLIFHITIGLKNGRSVIILLAKTDLAIVLISYVLKLVL